MMRNLAITVLSMALTSVVIGNAYFQKKQFYPSVVYITKSNPSMAVIYIQAFIVVIIMGKLMRKLFFGELRAVELEHLMERSWYAITETCLAFTVFRDDFNPKFLALFTLLLFLKAFHWLADERVDYMERSPVISWLFHIRIISLLIILGLLDILFVSHAYQSTLNKGASVQLVFGFEYAILLTIVLNIVIKYVFHVNDFHELPWENKAVFLLYTELIMGFIKVILYFSFVIIMVRIYTLPLFAFRPMYYTVRAFKKAVNDVVMSRRAIRNMNTLYPDATAEELAAMDNVCIICREEMRSAAKKLPCNHIFHTSCLRSWFQRQQTCPTCRLNILRSNNGGPVAGAQGVAAAGGIGEGNIGGGAGVGDVNAAAAPAPAATPAPAPVPPHAVPGPSAPRVGPSGDGHRSTGVQDGNGTPQHRVGSGQVQGGSAFMSSLPPRRFTSAPSMFMRHLHSYRDGTSQRNAGGQPGSGNQQHPFSSGPGSSSSQFSLPESISMIPPYPFMVYNIPPPLPPLEGLSEEELRSLEQNTRGGLEQRIRCLHNIQTLMDTSVIMMQQYCAAVAVCTSSAPTQPMPTAEPCSHWSQQTTAGTSNNISDARGPEQNISESIAGEDGNSSVTGISRTQREPSSTSVVDAIYLSDEDEGNSPNQSEDSSHTVGSSKTCLVGAIGSSRPISRRTSAEAEQMCTYEDIQSSLSNFKEDEGSISSQLRRYCDRTAPIVDAIYLSDESQNNSEGCSKSQSSSDNSPAAVDPRTEVLRQRRLEFFKNLEEE